MANYFANKRKIGFTLAEVLITLGIIGVVAAITMPSVINHYKKLETVNKLKKVYTVLNQAIRLSEAQNGEYAEWENGFDIGAAAYYEKYWKQYLNTIKTCTTHTDCGYNAPKPWKYMNGNEVAILFISPKDRVPVLLSDGVLVEIITGEGNGEGYSSPHIYVDLNAAKEPNVAGKDMFVFVRDEKGLIHPYGYNAANINTYCSKNSSTSTNGIYCAAKIIRDGWKISDDYPW